jgi:hypothetical protein
VRKLEGEAPATRLAIFGLPEAWTPRQQPAANPLTGQDDSLYRIPVKRIIFAAACLGVCFIVRLAGQSGARNGEWRSYGGDIGHTRYRDRVAV